MTLVFRKPRPLPFEAAMLGKLLGGTDAATQRAFDVARAALAQHHRSYDETSCRDILDGLDPHVMESATTDVFAKSVQQAFAVDPGNIDYDLLNAFALPAYLLGMATAFLVLRGHVTDVMDTPTRRKESQVTRIGTVVSDRAENNREDA